MIIRPCSLEEFRAAFLKDEENPGDKFAKTFMAKAKAYSIWDSCQGIFNENGELLSAMVVTLSKRNPRVANFQLLHTFHRHRRKGAASRLLQFSLTSSRNKGAEYFRVSSEPEAKEFYEKNGIVFYGRQKSGCWLSIGKYNQEGKLEFDAHEPYIFKALTSNRKGSLCQEEKNILLSGLPGV